jgi:16S rRNA (guanine527-N7)-methyltransferase
VTDPAPTDDLAATLARHALVLSPEQTAQVEQYCRLLWEWNQKLNLTRHTSYELFVTRDLVDAQHLAALLEPDERVLDLGSGGGVPGLVVALLRPDVRVELCECIGKKARALEDMVGQLQLDVPVHATRIEEILERRGSVYNAVLARAVGPLPKMLRTLQPYWNSLGRLLVVKGPRWVEERGEARHKGLLRDLQLRRAVSYQPPGAEWESVVLALWPKNRPTPPRIGAADARDS